ncbi:unnamed protein product [Parnassius mnemosyne]|uniref:PIG-P domain-containing protein n=1 Tax=Parnassius mnemosyne TaxID=213953 RepID=A0AAV1KFQ2_9NEOP
MTEHSPAPTPARSLYGFFMYLFSKIALTIYCIWATVPDHYLHYLNIYYYPQKYWSTAVPIQFLVGLTIFAFFIYPSSNLMLTSTIDSCNTIAGPLSPNNLKTNVKHISGTASCVCVDERYCMKFSHPSIIKRNTVAPLQDLNIQFVCRKLYLNRGV